MGGVAIYAAIYLLATVGGVAIYAAIYLLVTVGGVAIPAGNSRGVAIPAGNSRGRGNLYVMCMLWTLQMLGSAPKSGQG